MAKKGISPIGNSQSDESEAKPSEVPTITQQAPVTPGKKPMDLVLEGGAILGAALVGALFVLEEKGYEPVNMAGTSAGAVVTTLYAAGYKASDLQTMLYTEDFSEFTDDNIQGPLKLLNPIGDLYYYGLYKGDVLLEKLTTWLKDKNIEKFGDLRHPTYGNDPKLNYRYKIQVIVSDITEGCMRVLPRDAAYLGYAPDDLPVALAVRASSSIPLFFNPVKFPVTQKNNTIMHHVVDGGLLSDYPIWLFDSDDSIDPPAWPTFGVRLVDEDPSKEAGSVPILTHGAEIHNIVAYLKDIIATLLHGRDQMYIEDMNFVRSITIDTHGFNGANFHMPKADLQKLYQLGVDAATAFFNDPNTGWDFNKYIAKYRSPAKKAKTRRERVWS